MAKALLQALPQTKWLQLPRVEATGLGRMNIFVINLDRRKDRLAHMQAQLQSFTWERIAAVDGAAESQQREWVSDPEWSDPILKRPMTSGELGCLRSHYDCWLRVVSSGVNALILEDDVTIEQPLNLNYYDALLQQAGVLYLGYREMGVAKAHSPGLCIPEYPYLSSSYCITPQAALALIGGVEKTRAIPVDEFLPLMLGYKHTPTSSASQSLQYHMEQVARLPSLKALALTPGAVSQLPRAKFGSDIEPTHTTQAVAHTSVPLSAPPAPFQVITVATDLSKASVLYNSAKAFGVPLTNLGDGVAWKGGDMQSPGGGHKLNLVKAYVSTIPDDTLVLFVDGYDTCFTDSLQSLQERFFGVDADIVIAAEKQCWPDVSLADRFHAHTEYKFPNSGVYMGTARALRRFLSQPIADTDDDQLYFHKRLLEGRGDSVFLDSENYFFQCLSGAHADVGVLSSGKLYNSATRCCFCVLHGNGNTYDKNKFKEITDAFLNVSKSPVTQSITTPQLSFLPPGPVQIVGNEIITVDFLSRDQCSKLIELATKQKQWGALQGDEYPGDEIRLRAIDPALFHEIETHLMAHVVPIAQAYWKPTTIKGVRDLFIIRYSPDTQKSLACHLDCSLVSGITYLNDSYEGGDTYFPRQAYSTAGTPVGKLVLWPAQVTHGHEGREVTQGTKYALVLWTSRFKGDVIN